MKREVSVPSPSKLLPTSEPLTDDEQKRRAEAMRLAKIANNAVKVALAGSLLLIGSGLGWYIHPGAGMALAGFLFWVDLFHWSLKKNPGRKSG